MDPFYALYKDAGFVPIEIGLNGIIALISFVGICLNLCLVYVTIKTKSLHRPCNILIAISAFFISFLLASFVPKFFIFLFGINFISLRTCYFIQFIPLIGAVFGAFLQMSIGVDRLIGVLCPIWYKLHGGNVVVFKIILFFAIPFTIIPSYIYYYGDSLHWDKQVMCNSGDTAHQPETHLFATYKPLATYCVEFLSYALIWLVFFCGKSQISLKNKRLVISLSIMMAMGLICFILNTIFFWFITILDLNIYTVEYVFMPISCGIFVFANSSTSPVLILCSTEYRNAFRKCFGLEKQQQHVQPTMNVVHISNYH